ncbi:MAG: hypothetical protein MUC96_09620 [Myxococcaceae bacterium]|jgi:hypothetical protein|nr:hypothetical protein [Myxococcaceae bacterium]
MKLALVPMMMLLWSPVTPREVPQEDVCTAAPHAIGDATKCKRKCNSQCASASNKSKCVNECRRACDR